MAPEMAPVRVTAAIGEAGWLAIASRSYELADVLERARDARPLQNAHLNSVAASLAARSDQAIGSEIRITPRGVV